MSNLFDRLGSVVKSEWNSRFGEEPDAPKRKADTDAITTPPSSASTWSHARPSVKSAYKMLELDEGASLDAVRAAYFDLARHYHPKTHAKAQDQALTAQKLLDSLTDALEVLEEHLLPVAESRRV